VEIQTDIDSLPIVRPWLRCGRVLRLIGYQYELRIASENGGGEGRTGTAGSDERSLVGDGSLHDHLSRPFADVVWIHSEMVERAGLWRQRMGCDWVKPK